jgi:hypothetical protein
MTTNINKKFTSEYMNIMIYKIIKDKYTTTIFYYLKVISNSQSFLPCLLSMEEIYKTDKMKHIIDMFSYINKEIKYNIIHTRLNDVIISKITELKYTFKEKIDERLYDILRGIELQIHIYGKHKCKAISLTTDMLCNNRVKKNDDICVAHRTYYKNREYELKSYLCKDTISVIMQYIE